MDTSSFEVDFLVLALHWPLRPLTPRLRLNTNAFINKILCIMFPNVARNLLLKIYRLYFKRINPISLTFKLFFKAMIILDLE